MALEKTLTDYRMALWQRAGGIGSAGASGNSDNYFAIPMTLNEYLAYEINRIVRKQHHFGERCGRFSFAILFYFLFCGEPA